MGAAAPVWNSMGGVNLKISCDDSCRIAKLKQLLRKQKKKKEEEEKEQEDDLERGIDELEKNLMMI